MTELRIGVMYNRDWAPEELPGFARQVEALGVDDLWVVEDLGWNGGISAASIALGATQRLRVGIGIMPAPLRSPALLAMEVATVARVFPGRLVAGIGHGVTEWMADVDAVARSPLALLEETIRSVRALLRGERVVMDGREVRLAGVQLVHPPTEPPPVVAGVVRPRSLELSGRVADGTVIAEGHGPSDVGSARASVEKGGASTDHTMTVFAFCCVGGNADQVQHELQPHVDGHGAWLGRPAEQVYTVSGTAEQAAERVRELEAAGADTVVLRMIGPEPVERLGDLLKALGR
ncbi:Flavin-dependent oxidoreductase, luciferase family (includes alkanesulfonate monooxygenase SsuD and methylene tetrahydromethanopterin reductase) [Streptomyces sp. 3213]|uniref:LLM class flavin-dependent oxidoreductase n=1 Tax=Streptomyces sp. 3213.3 TaxID=1855348 RepID=UPI00089CFD00|nr:LLM class flavin-dependent oxidoreductase [Streptomyces sp. 3213.3]SEC45532.1 Flavin-dependent oxidoreductase, luciferase family (includes alkanesulfonate monooxygenase SsuD and methylene tetrahydromethanopterin reductase) [Streptomyces sp. 3213] [Streptomyces sp. 3213.3]